MKRLHFYDREDRPWISQRLTTAGIVGHTTATSVRLWIRVNEPGDYHLVVARDPIPSLGKLETGTNARGKLRATLQPMFKGVKPVSGVASIQPHSTSSSSSPSLRATTSPSSRCAPARRNPPCSTTSSGTRPSRAACSS